MVAVGAVTAITGIVSAISASGKQKTAAGKAEEARERLLKEKDAFKTLDTSNPYLNMENTMEDLTVNQQEAEFTKQQQMQSQANIMGQMRGAAGSSGIGGLAQSLANQGSLDAQKASASIGAQESRNQQLERTEASKIQGKEREGDVISRQAEFDKMASLMGMTAQEMSAFQQLQGQAAKQEMDAYGMVATGAGQVATGVDNIE